MSDTRTPTAVEAALMVLVLDRRTRAHLRASDPKALQQACKALEGAGLEYQDPEHPDVCWYCFEPLEEGVCRTCSEYGRQLPASVWRDLPK